MTPHPAGPIDQAALAALYQQLLDAWNRRDAAAMAALFAEDGHVIGFDGSQYHGGAEIAAEIGKVFANHQTARYIWKIKEMRLLSPDCALLRAVVGMVSPGQTDLNPAVNALQTVVATRQGSTWRIELFQNTPAQFHGRPDLAQALTAELRQLL